MSVHNHDEEIINRFNRESKIAKKLREKAEKTIVAKVVNAILATDIEGLSKEDALKKLGNVIDDVIDAQ